MALRTIGSHMKKVLLTILSLIYLAVSVEAAGYLHDCVSTLGTCSTEQATGEEPFFALFKRCKSLRISNQTEGRRNLYQVAKIILFAHLFEFTRISRFYTNVFSETSYTTLARLWHSGTVYSLPGFQDLISLPRAWRSTPHLSFSRGHQGGFSNGHSLKTRTDHVKKYYHTYFHYAFRKHDKCAVTENRYLSHAARF